MKPRATWGAKPANFTSLFPADEDINGLMVVRAAEGSQLIRMGVSRMEEMNKKPQVTMLQVEAARSRLPTSRVLQGASEVSLWVSG